MIDGMREDHCVEMEALSEDYGQQSTTIVKVCLVFVTLYYEIKTTF